jgi:hypothetical protein
MSQIKAVLDAAKAKELATYAKFGAFSEVKRAAQAGVMWCLLFVPTELGAFAPVSRSWAFLTPTRTAGLGDEWVYVIFDWDNIFASYLFAGGSNSSGTLGRDIAYSNLVQVINTRPSLAHHSPNARPTLAHHSTLSPPSHHPLTTQVIKSKTAQGFIANFASAGQKSLDRTEPMIGAKVLLELYGKYKDAWLVELLFDDLLDWHGWFHLYRRLPPKNLVCLGSDKIPGNSYYNPDTLQSARLESGLDNSPMWDEVEFDKDSHKIQLYEIQASSLYVAEADALLELAKAIGRTADPQVIHTAHT